MGKTAEIWVILHVTIFSGIITGVVSNKLSNLKFLCLRDKPVYKKPTSSSLDTGSTKENISHTAQANPEEERAAVKFFWIFRDFSQVLCCVWLKK